MATLSVLISWSCKMGKDPRSAGRFRWLKWLGIGFLTLLIVGLSFRSYVTSLGKRRFEAAAAELDASDPGWRWEDIEARRETIPPEKNAALHIQAASQLLPKGWPGKSAALRAPGAEIPQQPETDSLHDRIQK